MRRIRLCPPINPRACYSLMMARALCSRPRKNLAVSAAAVVMRGSWPTSIKASTAAVKTPGIAHYATKATQPDPYKPLFAQLRSAAVICYDLLRTVTGGTYFLQPEKSVLYSKLDIVHQLSWSTMDFSVSGKETQKFLAALDKIPKDEAGVNALIAIIPTNKKSLLYQAIADELKKIQLEKFKGLKQKIENLKPCVAENAHAQMVAQLKMIMHDFRITIHLNLVDKHELVEVLNMINALHATSNIDEMVKMFNQYRNTRLYRDFVGPAFNKMLPETSEHNNAASPSFRYA